MLGAPDADVLVIAAGEDVVIVDARGRRCHGHGAGLAGHHPQRRVGRAARRDGRRGPGASRRRAQGADRVPDPGVGRGGRRQLGSPGDGRRIRQGARAVRPDHRHLPGRQAPCRQHARQRRGDHRGHLGRGARRRSGQRVVRRRGGRVARHPHADLQRAEQHSAARRYRRSPGSTTPTSTCAGPARWPR